MEIRRDTETGATSLVVAAYGADRASLEMSALDTARVYFGPEARLEIVPGYEAVVRTGQPPEEYFYARVTVREVT